MYTIKQIRAGLNYSQTEMAQALGICLHTYAKYEKSPELMSVALAQKISNLSGISIEDILFTH